MRNFSKLFNTSPRTRGLIAANTEGIVGVILVAVFSRLHLMGTAPEWVLQLGVVGLTIFSNPELLRWVKRRYSSPIPVNVIVVIDLAFLLAVGYLSSWGPWGLIAVALYTPKFFDTAGPQVWKIAFLFMIPAGILGQIAIHQHWIASELDEPLAHYAAIMMALICLQCLYRFGTNTEALLRAEDALRRNEERYRALVHNSSDIVTVADENRSLLFVSPAVESVGFDVESLVGTPIDARICNEDLEVFRSTFASALSADGEASVRCQVRFELPDGKLHWFEMVISDLRHLPAVNGVVLNARDITERRNLESQLMNAQKLESVGRLAAGVAHEINTPVQFVRDNLTFLQEAFLAICETDQPLQAAALHDEQISFYIEEIPLALRQSTDGMGRVATIVGAMKTFSLPSQSGSSACDVNEAIRNTVTVAHGETQGVAEVELSLGVLPPVLCVLSDLNQVILNLVVNAAQAIAESERTANDGAIGVTTFEKDGFIHIGVSDNGTGIASEVQGHVFDAFFTTKPVGKGTGQGLNHVYSTVTGYGGTVDFETTPGSGTTFWVHLPIEMSPRREPTRAGESRFGVDPDRNDKKALPLS
jgi:PAS domain S-box-containing protein